jgi:hypothetical protein
LPISFYSPLPAHHSCPSSPLLPYHVFVISRQLVSLLTWLVIPVALAAQANPFDQPIKPPAVAGATIDTPHLTVVTGSSAEKVAPGGKVSLTFDITPRRGIHVYAPGKHTYQVVRVSIRSAAVAARAGDDVSAVGDLPFRAARREGRGLSEDVSLCRRTSRYSRHRRRRSSWPDREQRDPLSGKLDYQGVR